MRGGVPGVGVLGVVPGYRGFRGRKGLSLGKVWVADVVKRRMKGNQ